jgi:CspA family cold shock protein
VASGAVFRFAIGWRCSPQDHVANSELHQPAWSWFKGTQENGQATQTQARLQILARKWLEGGLRDLGAGGKNNAGYGFFVEPGGPVFAPANSQATSQSALPTGYERGTVKDFGLGGNRSFGFIVRSNGAEIFVHKNELAAGLSNLCPGQKVIFKVGTGSKGPAAQDVRLEE